MLVKRKGFKMKQSNDEILVDICTMFFIQEHFKDMPNKDSIKLNGLICKLLLECEERNIQVSAEDLFNTLTEKYVD